MLIDWSYKSGKLLVSYIDRNGKYRYKHIPFSSPKTWVVDNTLDVKEDDARTWDGLRCIQVPSRRPTKYAVLDHLASLDKEDQDDILGYTNPPNIYFVDIETRADDGFPEPTKAGSEITLISVYCKTKVLMLGTRYLDSTQLDWIKKQSESHLASLGIKEITVNYECFETEFSLLKYFFETVMVSINVISGWNISGFDWPYLINRANRISGGKNGRIDITKASPNGEYTRTKDFTADTPKHKLLVDYMKIYEKWDTTVKVRENSSLDWVSNKLLGIQKVHYPGTLEQLLHENYPMYCFYNIIDCALVELIHQKQQYANIMFAMAKLAGIRTIDSLSAINITEGFLRKPLWEKRKIVFVKPEYDNDSNDEDEESIEGGYVKDPVPGLTSWLSVMDFNSLYPTTQRTFTITPENYKGGLFIENGIKYALRKDGRRSLVEDDDVITINEQVFSQKWVSPTKELLGEIYSSRKNYQRLKKEAKENMDKTIEKRKMLEHLLL